MVGGDGGRDLVGLGRQIPIVVVGIGKIVVLQQSIQITMGMSSGEKRGRAVADQIVAIRFRCPGCPARFQALQHIIGLAAILGRRNLIQDGEKIPHRKEAKEGLAPWVWERLFRRPFGSYP